MSAPQPQGPFCVPAFRTFVPRRLQPWIYIIFAFTFQLSGGIYLGALNEMIGGQSLLREDLLMCMYCNLAGMAIYFPLLFRTKFRFTNKTLLTLSATMVLLCNWAAMHVSCLPLLWMICLIEGCFKIQGTFECMSNIQLWMTPRRDFTVFFPLLHIIILCSIQGSDWLMAYFTVHGGWPLMHYFIIGLMLFDLIVLVTCTRHFRFMRKFPLVGIDWTGAALWVALLVQITYIFTYGDLLDWWHSTTLCILCGTSLITLGACLWRMFTIRHPYLEPKMWTYRHYVPLLILITLVEAFLATEYVLEEVFYEEGMHYDNLTSASLDGVIMVGIIIGCLFSLWWMKVKHYDFVRLIIVGMVALIGYLVGMYVTVSPEVNIEQLYLPVMCRGFAYAVLSATFMTCLHELLSFQHFFQSLCIFNMLHMVVGGVLGCAIYAQGLRYYVADNFARYGASVDHVAYTDAPFDFGAYVEHFAVDMELISIKQLYGWVIYAAIILLLLFLLYDAPARRHLKRMPSWKTLGLEMRKPFVRSK